MLRKRLDNGLDVVIQENRFSKMFALQCWIGVGSLHEETGGEEGISHCIEHMLFKGTRNYAVGEISRRVEFLGGEMNAYTSFDHTAFYLVLPAVHAAEAVNILYEAIFYSTFDAEELEREKEVILEEMKRNEDSPGHALGRRIFEQIYEGTKAALPIIGYESTVKGYTREMLLRFHRKWYQPQNMKVIAVGHVEAEDLMKTMQVTFGSVVGSAVDSSYSLDVKPCEGVSVHVITGDYEQPRLEIAFQAPGLLHDDLLALDMAAFALGSGESSRLHRKVRDEEQLTSVVGCSMFAPRFGGVFELSAMPHADNYLSCVEALGRELARLKYHEAVDRVELDRARANAKADRIYSEETVSGQARSIGNALQTPHELMHDLIVEAKMNRLTPHDVASAVDRWLKEDACVIACVLPRDGGIQAEQVKAAFQVGFRKPEASTRQKSQHKVQKAGVYAHALTPQVTLLYRQQNHNDLLNITAVCSGGLRSETAETAGLHHVMADLLGTATSRYTYDDMLRRIEGEGAVLAGFSGRDSFGLKLQCLSEQFESLMPLFAETLLEPRFPEAQLQSSKLEVFDDIQMERDSPASIAMRRFQEAIYGAHSYRYPVWGLEEVVQGLTCEGLLQSYEQRRDGSHWIISGVGRLPFEVFLEHMEKRLKGLNRAVGRPQNICQHQPALIQPQDLRWTKDREQVHLVMGTLGLNWLDPDRYTLDVLANALGGSGGQLFLKLRDEQSLAYSVAPLHSHGCHRGIFGVYMACSPHKVQDARQGILKVWDDLCRKGLDQAELDRARNYLIGSHEADMQRGDAQAMTMALMELYGLGYDDFETYTSRLDAIGIEDVKRVARRLLEGQERVSVRVGPQSKEAAAPQLDSVTA
jgi:zinc protease